MKRTPVIAIFDIGKTNKKLFLFDEDYRIVFDSSLTIGEINDEDGFPGEDLPALEQFIFRSLEAICKDKKFELRAINFSAYGATLVLIGTDGKPVTAVRNYLKPYPDHVRNKLYDSAGGAKRFSLQTASPLLGNLNSGLQLYQVKEEQPELYEKIKCALHLPQYLSFLLTGVAASGLTSIGCHTAMWDFERNEYHAWVRENNIEKKLAPIEDAASTHMAMIEDKQYPVGIGLHDSSAALIPYLFQFDKPFILISTGTWCISLNPFNQTPLTDSELGSDCLFYLQHDGKPVKASRIFSGFEHDRQVKRIAAFFNQNPEKFLHIGPADDPDDDLAMGDVVATNFGNTDLVMFPTAAAAYRQLMRQIVKQQASSTELVINHPAIENIYVDGGFSSNLLFMNGLAAVFPHKKVAAASVAQASALGAALVLHERWNSSPVPDDLVRLTRYQVAK